MSRPTIPDVPQDLDQALYHILAAMKERLELLCGERGAGLTPVSGVQISATPTQAQVETLRQALDAVITRLGGR